MPEWLYSRMPLILCLQLVAFSCVCIFDLCTSLFVGTRLLAIVLDAEVASWFEWFQGGKLLSL